MKRYVCVLSLLLAMVMPAELLADKLPFSKSRLLRKGMSAAEVLYQVGPPDYRQVLDPYWTNKQAWFYIPRPDERDPWQTTIYFDNLGNIRDVERTKILRDWY